MSPGIPSRAATIIAEPPRMSIGAGRVLLKPKARAMLSLFVPTSPGAAGKSAHRTSAVMAVWRSTRWVAWAFSSA